MRSTLAIAASLMALGGLGSTGYVYPNSSSPSFAGERGYLGNPQYNLKRKPCGRKRTRKPRVTSPASHHHARYLKRQKKRDRQVWAKRFVKRVLKEALRQRAREDFKAEYIAHMKERLK